jgi:hypothetical protein
MQNSNSAERAIWIWESDTYQILENENFKEKALQFLKEKRIKRVFIYADAYQGRNVILTNPELYRRLISDMHKQGFSVYALLGSAYLRTQEYIYPEKRRLALEMFQRILDYNYNSQDTEKFDGVNFDIEPHLLKEWKKQEILLLTWFVDLSFIYAKLKEASRLNLNIGPAIPFWFDSIEIEWSGKKKKVSEHLQDIYDYTALMDYRNRAEGNDGIIAHAKNEIEYSTLIKKKVMIGVETLPDDEFPKVTFYNLDESALERELKITEEAYKTSPAFDGFVIHHFSSYKKWLEKRK